MTSILGEHDLIAALHRGTLGAPPWEVPLTPFMRPKSQKGPLGRFQAITTCR